MCDNYSATLLTAIGLALFSCNQDKKEEKSGKQQGNPVVDVYVAAESAMDVTETYAGVFLPFEEVALRTETAGRVTEIGFSEGSSVSKGQLLVKVNDADLVAQLSKTDQQLALAQVDEKRKQELLKLNGISREEYDQALSQVNTLKAEADYYKAAIAKTEVRAPFAGTVGLRQISVGAYVNNATEIGVLRQTDALKLEFSLPEKMASAVKKGMVVGFNCAGSAEVRTAEVYAWEPGIDLSTRTMKVRAVVKNGDGALLAGSFATVQVRANQSGTVIVVPTQAVVPVAEGEAVCLLKGGKARQQKVKTGYRTPTQVVVEQGISVGDSVVLTGFMQLKANQPVTANVLPVR